jgi:general secretion pathway protein L
LLAAALTREPAINLLQGEFAPSHRHMPARKLWRRAALLAAASVILALAYAGGDYLRLKRESDRLELAQHQALRASLPEFADVAGDPRQLMQSALTRMRGDGATGGLLPLPAGDRPVLATTTRVSLKSMEYRNATLELPARRTPTLDLVREQLANLSGLKAEVTAAATSDKGVDGRLRISEASR